MLFADAAAIIAPSAQGHKSELIKSQSPIQHTIRIGLLLNLDQYQDKQAKQS